MADVVVAPAHYQAAGGIEAIDVIEGFGLNFRLGNAVKYILRAGKKDRVVQDLEKAMWYLARDLRSSGVTAERLREIVDQSVREARP